MNLRSLNSENKIVARQIILWALLVPLPAFAGSGQFVNPITDICWSCLFPLTIGPVTVNNTELLDTENPDSFICVCPKPPLPAVPGIPIGFWEPVRLIDVTREPFNMVSLGGIKLGPDISAHGTHGLTGDRRRGQEQAFYHVHLYVYPVMYWLELVMDILCLEQSSMDVVWMSEFDPTWNDDEMNFILNPEAVLFSNPIAQAACAGDCIASTVGKPLDPLFWCAGCQGSLYPFSGSVSGHVGGVQSSLLLAERLIAKLHRVLLMWGTSGSQALCQKYPMPIVKKTQYRLQMAYPVSATRKELGCHPFGRNSFLLNMGREFPVKGEDFAYLMWRKRNCCLL